MKKLEPRRYVIVGDTTYYHGDYVTALIERIDDEDEEQDGIELQDARICINKVDQHQKGERHFHFWICQDDRDGCSEAEEKFEFRYSWSVKVNKDGDIISGDTTWINLESRAGYEDSVLEVEEKDVNVVDQHAEDEINDDPMPPDWVPTEKDLIFLKN